MTIEGTADKGTLREALYRLLHADPSIPHGPKFDRCWLIADRLINGGVAIGSSGFICPHHDDCEHNHGVVRAALSSKDEPLDVERRLAALEDIASGSYDTADECRWCGWDMDEGHAPSCATSRARAALSKETTA